MKRAGCKVYQTLITCQTASSDSWATTVNQSIDPTFAQHRLEVNAGIVAAMASGLIDGYININAAWEDPANPGKFLPNYTTDGTHPVAAGHIAAASIVASYATANFF